MYVICHQSQVIPCQLQISPVFIQPVVIPVRPEPFILLENSRRMIHSPVETAVTPAQSQVRSVDTTSEILLIFLYPSQQYGAVSTSKLSSQVTFSPEEYLLLTVNTQVNVHVVTYKWVYVRCQVSTLPVVQSQKPIESNTIHHVFTPVIV